MMITVMMDVHRNNLNLQNKNKKEAQQIKYSSPKFRDWKNSRI